MRRFFLGAALFIFSTHLLNAQPVGQINPGQVWGNATASRAPAGQTSLSPLLDRAFTATQGCILDRGASLFSCTRTPTLGLPGTATGTLSFGGVTSGTATLTPQATAGTPTLTLPNTSGTLVSNVASPFQISATTGALSFIDAPTVRSYLSLGTIALQNSSAVTITGGTITGIPSPTVSADVANKAYVDNVASGISNIGPSKLATAAVLPDTPTYSNGTAGVGATLTGTVTMERLVVDGVNASTGDIILVWKQAAPEQNGQYYVNVQGSGAAFWQMTRCDLAHCAQEFDSAATMLRGSYTFVSAGSTLSSTAYSLQGAVTTVGTTAATFVLFSGATAGVSSIGSQTGALLCGAGLNCTTSTLNTAALGGALSGTLPNPTIANSVVTNAMLFGGAYSAITGLGTQTSNLIFTDNTYDIGASGATRPRTGYFGTSVITPALRVSSLNYTTCQSGLSADASGNVFCGGNAAVSVAAYASSASTTPATLCGGSVAGEAALVAAYTAAATVIVPIGCTLKISANTTFPTGRTLIVPCGAVITVDSTKLLTVNGTFMDAGACQLFAGSGSVKGMKIDRPEWRGALNTGSAGNHDDAPALQASLDSLLLSSGSDGVKPTLILSQGYGSTPGYYIKTCVNVIINNAVNIEVAGGGNGSQGANIIAASIAHGWNAGSNCAVHIAASTTTGTNGVQWNAHDFQIQNEDPANSIRGLSLGVTGGGTEIINGQLSPQFRNISIINFPVGMRIVNTRGYTMDQISVTLPTSGAGIGVQFINDSSGDTGGDFVWSNSQITCAHNNASNASPQIGIDLNSQVAGAVGIAGGDFNSITIYACDTHGRAIAAAGSGPISNMVFDKYKWDGFDDSGSGGLIGPLYGFRAITDNSATSITNFTFSNGYAQQYRGRLFSLEGGVAYNIQDFGIIGGWANNISTNILSASNTLNTSITGMRLGKMLSGTEFFYFVNSVDIIVNGNTAYNHGVVSTSYFVTLDTGADAYCPGTNNVYSSISGGQFTNNVAGHATHITCNTP